MIYILLSIPGLKIKFKNGQWSISSSPMFNPYTVEADFSDVLQVNYSKVKAILAKYNISWEEAHTERDTDGHFKSFSFNSGEYVGNK